MRITTEKRLLALAASLVCSMLVVIAPVASPTLAQTSSGDLAVSKSAPGEVLAGAPITYGLTASNTSVSDAYFNLSFRDVLPLGVTYVGPTEPAGAGEPQIITNNVVEPVSGQLVEQQTLIWSNVADLQTDDDFSLTFTVDVNTTGDPARTDVHVVGATVSNTGEAYASTDPRQLPTFNSTTGAPNPSPLVDTATSAVATTTLTAIEVTKTSDAAPEGELLRGVHDHVVNYALTIDVTSLGGTDDITVVDLIPAAMEFLGCGGADNSTAGPGSAPLPEYPGAPLLSSTPAPPGVCVDPIRVETVVDPVLGGVTRPGVYTLVEWPLGDRAAGETITLPYAAGIPLFANEPFPPGFPTDGPQASNLDNNTGPSTRETTSVQSVTNVARGEGNFVESGLLEPGTPSLVGDTDTLTREVRDIRIRKEIVSPADGVFLSGAEADYRIVVETSEYMDASDIVLTDTLPNGLCPMGNVPYPAPEVQCSVNRNPTPPFTAVTPLASGGYEVVFAPIASLPANGTFVASYSAFMRGTYEGGSLDGQPTVSGDAYTNVVRSLGTTTGIADLQPPVATFPPDVWQTQPGLEDDSSATLSTTSLSLDKQLLPRDVLPRLDASTPAVDRCPDPSGGQYIDADATPTPADADALGFRLGDQICFRLRVDFSDSIRTRNAVITDFVPVGTEFVAGSIRAATANTTPFDVVDQSATGPLVFELGSDGVDGRYVNIGAVFDVVFAVSVNEVPQVDEAVLTGNLMKMRTENSAGQAQSFRDVANFGIVPPPPLGVVKGVQSVDSPPTGPNIANSNVDGVLVQQGSQVTFRIDLTNLGVPEDFTNYSARELEVLDVLPTQIDCGDISNIVNFGPVTNLGVCLDTGQSAGGFTNTLPGGVSVIRWAFDSSDAYALYAADATQPVGSLGTRTLTYTMTIPSPTSVSTRFDNDAGVRTYGGFTNLQGIVSPAYVPEDNIDPALDPVANAPAAVDDSWVETPEPDVEKFVTTWIQESGNNTSSPSPPAVTRPLPIIGTSGQAVIGEYVTYRYYVDIPAQTTVYDGNLTDPPPANLQFVPSPPAPVPAASLTFYPDASSTTTDSLPGGVTFDPATGAVAFGPTYSNTTGTVQRFEVVISARVVATPALSSTAQPTRRNTASFVSLDGTGTLLLPITDFADVGIRQPQADVTKTASSALVIGGNTVTYTLQASTASGRPPLHDAWLEDCVPVGLENVALVPSVGPTIGPLTGAAAEAEGCATGETYVAFGLGTLVPGAAGAQIRQFTAEVSLQSVGGQEYTNTVTLTGSSLNTGNSVPGDDDPNERVYTDTDTEIVTVRGAGVIKTVDPAEARIGERVEFTVAVEIPPNTNFYQAALVDRLPLGLVDPQPVVGFPTCVLVQVPPVLPATACPDSLSVTVLGPVDDLTPTQPPPPAPPLEPASVYGLYFGDVVASPDARLVTMKYTVRIADVPGNVDGVDLVNSAQTRWDLTNETDDPDDPLTYPWDVAGSRDDAIVEVIEPDVTVSKVASDDTPDPGQVFTYTLTVRNDGTSEAYNVVVTDTLPAGVELVGAASAPGVYDSGSRTITWDANDLVPPLVLQPGTSVDLTYQARLAPSATIGSTTPVGSFTNTASVTNFESLPTGGRVDQGNTATEVVTPQFPELNVDKTLVTPAPAYLNQPVTWRIQITNTGDSAAFSVDMADTLPRGWTYQPGSTTVERPALPAVTPDPDVTGGILVPQRLAWDDLGTLLPGESFVVTFRAIPTTDVVAPPPDPFPGGSLLQVNNAEAQALDSSASPGNLDGPYADSDDAATRIDSADVRIVKTNAADPPVAGATYSWTLVVSNLGPDTAVGPFTVVDTLPILTPGPLSFVSATGMGWTCSQTSGTVTCTRPGTLPSGAAFPPISVTVRPPADYLGSMTNTASVSNLTYDPNLANNTSTADVTVIGRADLQIVKSRTEPTIIAGRSVTYTLAVDNIGPSTSRETITVVDTLPSGTTFVSAPTAPGDPWDCVEVAGVVTCTLLQGAPRAPFGDLLAGSPAPPITITIDIPANTPPGTTTLTNTAVVNPGSTVDPVPGNNTSSNVGTVAALADLAIQKTSTGTLVAGEQATYRLEVRNIGPSDAASPLISDTLPAGLTYAGFTSIQQPSGAGSWNCGGGAGNTSFTCTLNGSLAPGGVAIVDVDVDVSPSVLGPIVNTATVSSVTPDANLDNNTDDDSSEFGAIADLQIVKSGPTDPVTAGTNFTWTLAVTNLGPSVSRQPVTVTDALPTGVEYVGYNTASGWSCTNTPSTVLGVSSELSCALPTDIGFPAPGNTAPPILVEVRILPDAGPALIENTAVVSGTTTDPDLDNNTDDHTISVVDDADLQIEKSPDTQTVHAGELATFTLQVTNNGPSTADDVVVTDTLPSGMTFEPLGVTSPWACTTPTPVTLSCALATLPPGAAIPITVPARVGSGVVDGTTLTNDASVASATPDRDLSNNADTADVDVGAEADLAITKTHPNAPVDAGDDLEFTIVVENLGPSDAAADVTVVDTLPPGFTYLSVTGPWSCTPGAPAPQDVTCTYLGGPLAAGGATQFDMLVSIAPDLAAGTFTNLAEVSSPTVDPDLDNNETDDVVQLGTLADVSVVKTHDADDVQVGEELVFTLTVRNGGPSDAQDVVVTDALPTGLTLVSASGSAAATTWDCAATAAPVVRCTLIGALPAGTIAETILVTAEVQPEAYPSVDNIAEVASSTPDVDLTNNSSTDEIVVPPLVDLSITKSHADPVAVGGTITYTIVTTNAGPTPDPGPIVISDTLPASLTPRSATASANAVCGIVLQVVTCVTNTPLAVGATVTVTIVANVLPAAAPSVTNVASVGTSSTETDLANNQATDVATVSPLIRLEVLKSLGELTASTATWLMTVTNLGPNDTVEPVVLVDQLPAGLQFVSVVGDGWTCTESGGRVECTYAATLASGAATPELTLVTAVTAPAGSTIVNTATVEGGGPGVPSVDDDAAALVPMANLPTTGGAGSRLLELGMMLLFAGAFLRIVSRESATSPYAGDCVTRNLSGELGDHV